MQKTDAHLHIDLQGLETDQLIGYMNAHDIERCWLLTWEEQNPPISSLYQNLPPEDVFDAYEKYPDRIVPFYAPDPKTANLEEKIRRSKEKGLQGCGELKVTHKWEDKVIGNYLRVIDKHNLPLLFHMEEPRMHYVPKKSNSIERLLDKLMNGALNGITKYYLSLFSRKTNILKDHLASHMQPFPGYLYDFANLEQRIKQFPDLVFIGHGPHFWNNISDAPPEIVFHDKGPINYFGIIDRLLEVYPNFYCDISGKSGFNALTRDKEKARLFLEKHHKKVLFGTDNTGLDFEGLIRSFNLPQEHLKSIFSENADRIIGV